MFLTNLTHTFITIYYASVFIQDIFELLGSKAAAKNGEYVYHRLTHTFYQLTLSMSLIVAIGYWGLMIIDPQLLWGKIDPNVFNVYYAMTYLHGLNHLHFYLELPLYK